LDARSSPTAHSRARSPTSEITVVEIRCMAPP
jgi:hypothetical protein